MVTQKHHDAVVAQYKEEAATAIRKAATTQAKLDEAHRINADMTDELRRIQDELTRANVLLEAAGKLEHKRAKLKASKKVKADKKRRAVAEKALLDQAQLGESWAIARILDAPEAVQQTDDAALREAYAGGLVYDVNSLYPYAFYDAHAALNSLYGKLAVMQRGSGKAWAQVEADLRTNARIIKSVSHLLS